MGDYDVVIPENAMSGFYSIRVGEFENEDVFGCSEVFEVVGDDESDDVISMSFDF